MASHKRAYSDDESDPDYEPAWQMITAPVPPPVTLAGRAALRQLASDLIADGMQHLSPPGEYVAVKEHGPARARVRAIFTDRVAGKRSGGLDIDQIELGALTADLRYFVQYLLQECVGFPACGFVGVVTTNKTLAPVLLTVNGWSRTYLNDPDSDTDLYVWTRPQYALGAIPPDVERLLTRGHLDDAAVFIDPLGSLYVGLSLDRFEAPVQQAQLMDDEDGLGAPVPTGHGGRLQDPVRFRRFFGRVADHCCALGNFDVDRGGSFCAITIDSVTPMGTSDPTHAQRLLAYVIAMARVHMRPVFLATTVMTTLFTVTAKRPFDAVADLPPYFFEVPGEEYMCWIPQARVPGEPAERKLLAATPDEPVRRPASKRLRANTSTFECRQCGGSAGRVRYTAPVCSAACARAYYHLVTW